MDQGQSSLDGQLSQNHSSWILPDPSPRRETQSVRWKHPLTLQKIEPAKQSQMTIANFVEGRFVPEHVAFKTSSGRAHYQAILKLVLNPEEVDRAFHIEANHSKSKLNPPPDWPYLGSVQLRDTKPCHVQELVSAAMARGYSTQTVKHIRSVVSAVFSHAIDKNCFEGDNPASHVSLPEMVRKPAYVITPLQAQEVLSSMRYPEKEMTLFAVLTGMNVAEICGLQWKCLNLTSSEQQTEVGAIPARTITIRKHLYRGELANVAKNRMRYLRIPKALVSILIRLSQRSNYTAPDDFVLVSRNGSAINQTNIVVRRLRPIGKDLQMPWLTWQVFRRAHSILASETGRQFQELIASMAHSDLHQEARPLRKWRGVSRLAHPAEKLPISSALKRHGFSGAVEADKINRL